MTKGFSYIFSQMWQQNKPAILRSAASGFIHELFAVAQPLIIAQIFLSLSMKDHEMFMTNIKYYIIAATGLLISLFIKQITTATIMRKIPFDSLISAYKYLVNHSSKYFSNNFTGSICSNIYSIEGYSFDLWHKITSQFMEIIIGLTITLYFLAKINIYISIFLLIFAILYIFGIRLLFKIVKPINERRAKLARKIGGLLSDNLSNHFNIVLYSAHQREVKSISEISHKYMQTVSERNKFTSLITGVQSLLIALLQITVLIFTLYLWREGTYNIADFTAINGLVMRFVYKIQDAPEIVSSMEESIAELDESAKKIYQPHDLLDNSSKKISITKGNIEFKNVHISYDSKKALSVDSIKIPSGQSLAIVGRSGAGKTTFVNSIIRLFDIDSGEILIDAQNIKNYTQDSLRGQIAYISQTPMLFHRSFFENIAYAKPGSTMQEVIKAAKQANIHEDISQTEEGYHTLVGERGVKLSGGQRQRIAIARAFLKKSHILILDEATSALDAESEKLIQESFNKLSKGKTTLVVAHRLSTIKNVDRVLVFNDGKIIEDGTHDKLKSFKDGVFKKLLDLQKEAF